MGRFGVPSHSAEEVRQAVEPRLRLAPRSGRSGRRTRAPAVGAARPDCGSVGGVRGLRAARWLAGAAAERPPRAGAE